MKVLPFALLILLFNVCMICAQTTSAPSADRSGALAPDKQKTQARSLFEPDDGRVYHGVGQPPNGITEYHTMLGDSTIYPLVYKLYYSIPGTRGDKFGELRAALMQQKSAGRLPELSIEFAGKAKGTDSLIAVTSVYDYALDSLALICKEFHGRMLVRPGFEFNGPWNAYHPYLYVQAVRKLVDRFRTLGAADSCAFVWCYYPTGAANDFDSVDTQGARWYPGDSYVDWFGLDCFASSDFHPDSVSTRRGQLTSKGKSERFVALAHDKAKPVFLSEVSAAGVNISADQADSYRDWITWFEPFFRFISNHSNIKGFCYINWDWRPYPDWANWGDARIENSSYLSQAYRTEMKKSKYIHLHASAASPQDRDTIPTTPLTELDTMLWNGYAGGLYPNHSNQRPLAHTTAGLTMAQNIVPRLSDGTVDDVNGTIVLLSIGMSNCTQEFSAFVPMANADSLKNPRVKCVDGAQGGQTASIIRDSSANFWNVVRQRLQSSGTTPQQVQVVWLKEANASPTQAFPVHAQSLKNDESEIVRVLKRTFPNLAHCYVSSRIYAGYASSALNPEPYAYESGFAVKWLIEDQLNGVGSLNYNGARPQAPWLSWGPYLWAHGTTPRASDGLTWDQTEFAADGTHPNAAGQQKVARLLLDFFRNDECTKPWYRRQATSDVDVEPNSSTITLHPNPAAENVVIKASDDILSIRAWTMLGREIDLQHALHYESLRVLSCDLREVSPTTSPCVLFIEVTTHTRRAVIPLLVRSER